MRRWITLKKLMLTLSGLLLLCVVVPIFYSVFNTGSVVLLVAGVGIFIYQLAAKRLGRRMKIFCRTIFVLCAAGALTLSVPMVWQAWLNMPPKDAALPVIVLGGKVYESGPSRILANRLKTAARYLEENPDAVCVVSGGQGADEPRPEGAVMAEYLQNSCGIDAARIIIEDRSVNTRENLRFSAPLLEGQGEGGVVVVTDSFHQLRAAIYAKKAGLKAYGVSSFTPPGLLPAYWVRDMIAVLAAFAGD